VLLFLCDFFPKGLADVSAEDFALVDFFVLFVRVVLGDAVALAVAVVDALAVAEAVALGEALIVADPLGEA
jgi:hypothetical protein